MKRPRQVTDWGRTTGSHTSRWSRAPRPKNGKQARLGSRRGSLAVAAWGGGCRTPQAGVQGVEDTPRVGGQQRKPRGPEGRGLWAQRLQCSESWSAAWVSTARLVTGLLPRRGRSLESSEASCLGLGIISPHAMWLQSYLKTRTRRIDLFQMVAFSINARACVGLQKCPAPSSVKSTVSAMHPETSRCAEGGTVHPE